MPTQVFTLTPDTDYIALDSLLKLMRLVGSGGEAHAAIQEGMVRVNGEVELQKRKKMRTGDVAEFENQRIEIKA